MIILTIFVMLGIVVYKPLSLYWFPYHQWYIRFQDFMKKTNFLKITRIGFCLLFIFLYCFLRLTPAVENILNYDLFNAQISEFRSASISIALMLDICSFVGILMPILCIIDWKHKYLLKPLSVISVLGGACTIFFTISELYTYWDCYGFFFGSKVVGGITNDEPLMFLMHFWMVIIGLIVMTNTTRFKLKDVAILLLFFVLYLCYISGIAYGYSILSHVSAIVRGDVVVLDEKYYIFNDIIKTPHPTYQITSDLSGIQNWRILCSITWIMIVILSLLIMGIKNSCHWINDTFFNQSIFVPAPIGN